MTQNVVYGVEMERDNVEMISSPMNHSHGLRRYYANMYCGCMVVLLGSIVNVRRFFDNIETYVVNSMDLVPTALSILLQLTNDKFGNIRTVCAIFSLVRHQWRKRIRPKSASSFPIPDFIIFAAAPKVIVP